MEVKRYPVSVDFEITLIFYSKQPVTVRIPRRQDLRQMVSRLRKLNTGIKDVQVLEIRIKDLSDKFRTNDEILGELIADEQEKA